MLGRLDLPSQETMDEEVATWNVWTRKRYLAQGRKHAYAIYDYLSVRSPLVVVFYFARESQVPNTTLVCGYAGT